MEMEVEQGFKKADINNIPAISSEAIFEFVTRLATSGTTLSAASKAAKDVEYRIDYVQVKKSVDWCEVKGVVFSQESKDDLKYNVSLKIDEKNEDIQEVFCEQCSSKDGVYETCQHTIAFIFWLHRKSDNNDSHSIRTFWGLETEHLSEEKVSAMRIRDIFACDELRMEADMEADNVCEEDGQAFLNTVLDEMEKIGLTDSAMYKHCRPVVDEFESVYIHHTMLDTGNNYVKDFKSFMLHMDDVAKQGLFDKLSEVSIFSYKSPLWQETQYCRLRCSLIHRVASRKEPKEDEEILEAVFCKEREYNIEERRQLKQHKRFILKQTEKLENKTYRECGLLLNESYPYICASPDGITDDHIVEIKAPKTDEEFEKYLECKETIAPKYMAQIQIQMYMANVTKALYCVLSPTFDLNGALHYVWVQADMEFVASLLSAAEDYWKDVVFPKISKIYIDNH